MHLISGNLLSSSLGTIIEHLTHSYKIPPKSFENMLNIGVGGTAVCHNYPHELAGR